MLTNRVDELVIFFSLLSRSRRINALSRITNVSIMFLWKNRETVVGKVAWHFSYLN